MQSQDYPAGGERREHEWLILSDERALHHRLRLAVWRDGYQVGEQVGYRRGFNDSERERDELWHVAARPIARGLPYDEQERRRWRLRGEERTREMFGQPHPDDFRGRAA